MIINTKSIFSYNNNLTRVTDDMKLGVNNHINLGIRNASLRLIAGRPSKINPPNSHPSNPIHKQATEARGLAVKKKPTTTTTQTQAKTDPDDSHHVNKELVALGALALVGFVIWAGTK